MEIETIIVILAILIGVGVLVSLYLITRKLDGLNKDKSQDQSIILLQKQLSELTRDLNDRMVDQQKEISKRLNESTKSNQQQFAITTKNLQTVNEATSKIVREVTEKLTKLDDTNKQVVDFAKQLQSLENILKNPKQRGVLGEYFLETLLGNLLPPSNYKMQYKFKNGDIVDAAIYVKDRIIPIDAKFSLENYNKIQNEKNKTEREKLIKQFKLDLKGRIDETSKYIRPEERTVDFAFMFIPAEGVYYNLLVFKVGSEVSSKDLIEYAFSKKVLIVSPNSFFAYLQTVLQALKTLQVQESVQGIIKKVRSLQRHLETYDENMQKLGKHLGTTVNTYNNSYREFNKIDKDVVKITGNKKSIEPVLVEKPHEFDER